MNATDLIVHEDVSFSNEYGEVESVKLEIPTEVQQIMDEAKKILMANPILRSVNIEVGETKVTYYSTDVEDEDNTEVEFIVGTHYFTIIPFSDGGFYTSYCAQAKMDSNIQFEVPL